jgi:TRAP-type C4-dicarboxylate transport system permease small subunit
MKQVFRFFQVCDKVLIYSEMSALCLLLFSMILLAFGQVVARNVWQGGTLWIEEALRLQVLWICFIAGAHATEFNRHVRIDILSHLLGTGIAAKIMDVIAQTWLIVICAVLFGAAIEHLKAEAAHPSYDLIPQYVGHLWDTVINVNVRDGQGAINSLFAYKGSNLTINLSLPDWLFRAVIPYFFIATVVRGVINIGRVVKGTHVRAASH